MIKAARLSEIENLLRDHAVLATQEIADALDVSTATVRRDLDALSSTGRIERLFGGARIISRERVPIETASGVIGGGFGGGDERAIAVDEPFDQVAARNAESKARLAHAAAAMVRPGDTIYLDIGTTASGIAGFLTAHDLTVATSSLSIVDRLAGREGVDLILLGGEFNAAYRCTQGATVERELRALQVDRVFLGCSGISERGAVRDTDAVQARVKRAAVATGAEVILLADSTKLPGTGAHQALDLSDISRLVTDATLPEPYDQICSDNDVKVTSA